MTASRQRSTTPPLVSCIVPVFNGERYLAEALESVFRQTHDRLEVIVVDDGSSDSTPEVIAGYAERVRSLRQDNAGPAAARNRGLREAQGEFVAFIDADDLWHPEKLARQLSRFEERRELDASITQAQNFWIPELRAEAERFRDHRIARPAVAALASTLLTRRRVFELVGDFEESRGFTHSTEWFLRAAEHNVVVEVLPEVLYHRRLHHENRSRRLQDASHDEYIELIKRHLDRQRTARVFSPAATGTERRFWRG